MMSLSNSYPKQIGIGSLVSPKGPPKFIRKQGITKISSKIIPHVLQKEHISILANISLQQLFHSLNCTLVYRYHDRDTFIAYRIVFLLFQSALAGD